MKSIRSQIYRNPGRGHPCQSDAGCDKYCLRSDSYCDIDDGLQAYIMDNVETPIDLDILYAVAMEVRCL